MSRVVLYRVKRPDGTVIPTRPAFHPATAVKNAWKDRFKYDSDLLKSLGKLGRVKTCKSQIDKMAEEAGYTIEPVEYIPASAARGLVEALKDLYVIVDDAAKTTEPNWIEEMCGTNEEAVKRADAALAAAEEALK